MSLLNFNPPPLATPDTARPAHAPAPVEDDAIAADLFAQLVAAASATTNGAAPWSKTEGADRPASGDDESKTRRVHAAAVDLIAALAGAPVAAPIEPSLHEAMSNELPSTAVASEHPVAARERAVACRIEVDPRIAHERGERAGDDVARGARGVEPLREHLVAAFASHTNAPAAPALASAAADGKPHDSVPTATVAKAPAEAHPLAAALAAAIDRDRGAEHAPATRPALAEPPLVAAAPTASLATQPQPSASATARLVIDTPVGAPGFGDEVASKIAHVALRADRAELRVSPPDLGPVEIRIGLARDQASVSIVAAQPATRDALEQALPQLRDALAAQGIALAHTSIHDGRAHGDHRHGGHHASPRASNAEDDAETAVAAVGVRMPDRIVDTFA